MFDTKRALLNKLRALVSKDETVIDTRVDFKNAIVKTNYYVEKPWSQIV